MGLAGALVVLLTCASAILVLPALLAILGHRVNALAPAWLQAPDPHDTAAGADEGRWYRLARFVMAHPIPVALGAATVLLAIASPVLTIKLTSANTGTLPHNASPRQVGDALQSDFRIDPSQNIAILTTHAPAPALATRDELVLRTRDSINVQSYVRGRIAQYLETTEDTGDVELDQLKRQAAQAEEDVAALAAALDTNAIRSRTESLLRTVSRQMTAWGRQLHLEHAGGGALIDLDRLTIVADTPSGPAYMDAGGIGSGMNWVGYHLTAYLALQHFFIEHARPVPSFIVLDQPSQAFFPRDRERGGDLDELTDTDRENTRQLYQLTHEVVAQMTGALQVIALDHADFEDPWFAESVVERWRGGDALIPPHWRSGNDESDSASPEDDS